MEYTPIQVDLAKIFTFDDEEEEVITEEVG